MYGVDKFSRGEINEKYGKISAPVLKDFASNIVNSIGDSVLRELATTGIEGIKSWNAIDAQTSSEVRNMLRTRSQPKDAL